ncbi:MAG: hypothetical protein AB7N24_23385 [Dehalococcoidia bacterium]
MSDNDALSIQKWNGQDAMEVILGNQVASIGQAWNKVVDESKLLLMAAYAANLPDPAIVLLCDSAGHRCEPLVALYRLGDYWCEERFVQFPSHPLDV